MFVQRFIKYLATFFCIIIPLQLLGTLILFPLCYFYGIGKLPRIFRWFDSADPHIGRNTEVVDKISNGEHTKYNFYPYPTSHMQITINRYMWLAWRNPLNYFAYTQLGFTLDKSAARVLREDPADLEIGDSPGDHPGLFHIEIEQHGKTFYEYYWIYPYTFPGKGTVCIRFRMGWKISQSSTWKDIEHVQWVFVISPVKSYSGIL